MSQEGDRPAHERPDPAPTNLLFMILASLAIWALIVLGVGQLF